MVDTLPIGNNMDSTKDDIWQNMAAGSAENNPQRSYPSGKTDSGPIFDPDFNNPACFRIIITKKVYTVESFVLVLISVNFVFNIKSP